MKILLKMHKITGPISSGVNKSLDAYMRLIQYSDQIDFPFYSTP